MITRSFLKVEKIKELQPAFCDGYGWLSIQELNLLDPNGDRFTELEEVSFECGSIFVNVMPLSTRNDQAY